MIGVSWRAGRRPAPGARRALGLVLLGVRGRRQPSTPSWNRATSAWSCSAVRASSSAWAVTSSTWAPISSAEAEHLLGGGAVLLGDRGDALDRRRRPRRPGPPSPRSRRCSPRPSALMLSIASTTLRAPAAICCAAEAIPLTSATVTSTAPRISSSALPAWSAFCEPGLDLAGATLHRLDGLAGAGLDARGSARRSPWSRAGSARPACGPRRRRPRSPGRARRPGPPRWRRSAPAGWSARRCRRSSRPPPRSSRPACQAPRPCAAASPTTCLISSMPSTVSRTACAPCSAEARVCWLVSATRWAFDGDLLDAGRHLGGRRRRCLDLLAPDRRRPGRCCRPRR